MPPQPGPAIERTSRRWLPSTSSFDTRLALLGSWAVSAAGLAGYGFGRVPLADGPGDLLRLAAGLGTLGAASAIFARSQLRLVRDEVDPHQPWLLLGLGLIPLSWGDLDVTLAFGVAMTIVRLDTARALAVLGATGGVVAVAPGGSPTPAATGTALVEVAVAAGFLAAATHLAVSADRLRRLREQLTRHRVDLERERVARDLHDLMGRTLVTASLRTQTLLRVLGDGGPRLRTRLLRLQDTLTVGQQRVRAATSGLVITTWDDEVEISRALCARVGIRFVVTDPARLPSRHRPLAGLVLRDAVTTALRHRRTTRIDAVLGVAPDGTSTVRVAITGPAVPTMEVPRRLTEAIAEAGGSITASAAAQTWTLDAQLPSARSIGTAR